MGGLFVARSLTNEMEVACNRLQPAAMEQVTVLFATATMMYTKNVAAVLIVLVIGRERAARGLFVSSIGSLEILLPQNIKI